ncbi:MAG: N-(5'-phosphoribosyl)anthranilate isomerase [Flavobacteriaceae bacterium]|nr:N-(5'-phosphoribosyl)anthranilate isomerase [Flavobacteriaceae bacterium]|tara:strand:- start:17679 stop:18299 length:621 start_codon:yes stop_codon:yes gene_type:complete
MKLKICGMKESNNIKSIENIEPDYMGFIFWEDSPRYIKDKIPLLKNTIKKTGVFVDSNIEYITKAVENHNLQAIQLHGNESPEFCAKLMNKQNIELIKAFKVDDSFNFDELKIFENQCDFFLFDTKGKLPGGNGSVFEWSILKDYKYEKPFFLSGGIGIENVDELINLKKTRLPIYAVDVNSKFESQPGLKKLNLLEEFKNKLYEL